VRNETGNGGNGETGKNNGSYSNVEKLIDHRVTQGKTWIWRELPVIPGEDPESRINGSFRSGDFHHGVTESTEKKMTQADLTGI